jgi:hypothetical protein
MSVGVGKDANTQYARTTLAGLMTKASGLVPNMVRPQGPVRRISGQNGYARRRSGRVAGHVIGAERRTHEPDRPDWPATPGA